MQTDNKILIRNGELAKQTKIRPNSGKQTNATNGIQCIEDLCIRMQASAGSYIFIHTCLAKMNITKTLNYRHVFLSFFLSLWCLPRQNTIVFFNSIDLLNPLMRYFHRYATDAYMSPSVYDKLGFPTFVSFIVGCGLWWLLWSKVSSTWRFQPLRQRWP